MAEEAKKVEPEASVEPPPSAVETVESPKDVVEEKSVIPAPPPPAEEKADECKALAVVEKPEDVEEKKRMNTTIYRDTELIRVANDKRTSLIKAWEESEKSKAENKAQKKLAAIGAWENCKKVSLEAELKKIEEQLEKKKAEYIEKTKNKIALSHKVAEEKRAIAEAKRREDLIKAEERREDLIKAEEIAAKYQATGTSRKKLLGFF